MSDQPTPPTPALRLKPRLRPVDADSASAPTPPAEGAGPVPAVGSVDAPTVAAAPVAPAVPTVPPPAAQEPQRFKLKPKAPVVVEQTVNAVPPPPAPIAPPLFITDPPPPAAPATPAATEAGAGAPAETLGGLVPDPVRGPKQGIYATGNAVKKTLPPFPTIALDGKDKDAPSKVLHLSSGDDIADLDPGLVLPPHRRRGASRPFLVVLGMVILAATGYFGWLYWQGRNAAKPAPAPVVAAPSKAPAAEKAAPLTPSETLNKLAQAPVNAINKAQDAIAARRAGEQARVDAVVAGEDGPNRPAPKIMAPKPTSTMTKVAPGLTAATPIDAEGESSRAFRLFVANARISGVFQGNPARAMINGKLTRAGERVDAELGIVFEGLSPDRHQLVFSDRSGAKVFRGY